MKVPNKSELLHFQLQALLRENSFSDLKYIGICNKDHYYCICGTKVSVKDILSIDSTEKYTTINHYE
jgi:hypothetical protein